MIFATYDRWVGVTDERSLRHLRQEARAFQEEVEASAAQLAASNRTVRDVLIDFGKQGSAIRIEAAGRSLTGEIEHVGPTLVRIITAEGRRVDVAFGPLSGIQRSRVYGAPRSVTTGHPGSLIARLRESVQTAELLHIERVSGEAIEGSVVAVLGSAVEVHTTLAEWVIPLDAIIWLWRLP